MSLDNTILLNALPALLILMAAEAIYMSKENRHNSKDMFANIMSGLVAVPLSFLTKGVVLYTYTFIYEYRLFTLSPDLWYTWAICFFADDFSFYWYHRFSHQVRFLWASHMVHHSSQKFTFSAALRSSWTSNLSGVFVFWAWMPLIGIEPLMILFFKTLSIAYQFWMHTETIGRLPNWFESIFNTPSHHRVHHASDVEYLDKNHAGTLIIWDKIFGTFKREDHRPHYGLTANINSFNVLVIQSHEWKNLFSDIRKSKNVNMVLQYLFNSPGWSPDGSTKTTIQLQAELRQEHKS